MTRKNDLRNFLLQMSSGGIAFGNGREFGFDTIANLWGWQNLPIDDSYPSANAIKKMQDVIETIKKDLRKNGFIGAGFYPGYQAQLYILKKLSENFSVLLRSGRFPNPGAVQMRSIVTKLGEFLASQIVIYIPKRIWDDCRYSHYLEPGNLHVGTVEEVLSMDPKLADLELEVYGLDRKNKKGTLTAKAMLERRMKELRDGLK